MLGFRRFSMRGKEKAETEWCLVCLSYNLKKIFKLAGKCVPNPPSGAAKQHAPALFAAIRDFPATFSFNLRLMKFKYAKCFSELRLGGIPTPTGC